MTVYRVPTHVKAARVRQRSSKALRVDDRRARIHSILSPFLRTKSGGAVLPLTVVTPLSKACFCIKQDGMTAQCDVARGQPYI